MLPLRGSTQQPAVDFEPDGRLPYGSNLGAVAERERAGTGTRGLGVELRLYNVHPREVEARARSAGHVVLQTTATKPHGLVECYVQGPGDYVWVPSCPTPAQPKL
jgi:hypothetical protein